jgi:hypothetical protein
MGSTETLQALVTGTDLSMVWPCWGCAGAVLGLCWGRAGAVLGPCWGCAASVGWGEVGRSQLLILCGSDNLFAATL